MTRLNRQQYSHTGAGPSCTTQTASCPKRITTESHELAIAADVELVSSAWLWQAERSASSVRLRQAEALMIWRRRVTTA